MSKSEMKKISRIIEEAVGITSADDAAVPASWLVNMSPLFSLVRAS